MVRLLIVFIAGCGNISVSTPKQISQAPPESEEERICIGKGCPDGGGKSPAKEIVKEEEPDRGNKDQMPPRRPNRRLSERECIKLELEKALNKCLSR